MLIKRGDIYYINKSISEQDCEQKSGRPAIIVSNDIANHYSSVVEVVYLTTSKKNDLPTHVKINSAKKASIALCEQITSVSIRRIGEYAGKCTPSEMQSINTALKISLALKIGAD